MKITRICIIALNIVLSISILILVLFPALKLMYDAKGLQVLENKNYYATINTYDPALLYDLDIKDLNSFFLEDFYDESSHHVIYKYLANIDEDGNHIQRRIANKNFFEIHTINISSGRSFSDDDFLLNSQEEEIPILVGSTLSQLYPLNSVHDISNGDDNQTFKARVVGVMEKDSTYPHLFTVNENLDNSYIIPMSLGFIEYYFGISDYYMATCNTIIDGYEVQEYSQIAKRSNEQNLFTLNFESADNLIHELQNNISITLHNRIKIVSAVIVILIIATFIELKLFKIYIKKRQ